MNRAGSSELAINFRITAVHAIFAHIDVVFGTDIAGLSVRMICAAVHDVSLYFELFSQIT